MKRMLAFLLTLALLGCGCAFAEEETVQVELPAGEKYEIEQKRVGVWENAHGDIASVEKNVILGVAPGETLILMIADSGLITRFEVTVTEPVPVDPVPPLVRGAIDLALSEWQENKGKTFSRLGSKNKFSRWQCGTGSGCNIGWCGAFVGYCLDNAGVPMDEYRQSVPHADGTPYAVRAAGVGKIYTGYENMERLTDVPRPGYLVIYGKRGGYKYTHVGMVTDVIDNGDGTYIVSTVEGNVSSRIKRYTYLYDKNGGEKNFKACPTELQTDTDTFQYTPHSKDWCITIFCQTWF